MSSDKSHIYQFDDYQLDAAERVLKRNGEIVPLPLKPFEVLLALVEQSGRVVSKEELMRQVWPDSFVEEANLARYIYLLRQTLGGSSKGNAGKHFYIQTIPGRGYRFACEVETDKLATEVEKERVFRDDEAITEETDPSHLRTIQQVEECDVASKSGVVAASRQQPRRSWRLSNYHWLAAMIALTFVVLSVFLIISNARIDEPPPEPTITRLTNNANVLIGSISPDGKCIVSIVEENGRQSVWVRLSTNGSERMIVPPSSLELGDLAFSPDSGLFITAQRQSRIASRRSTRFRSSAELCAKSRRGSIRPSHLRPTVFTSLSCAKS